MSDFKTYQDQQLEIQTLKESFIFNEGFKAGMQYAAQLFGWARGEQK